MPDGASYTRKEIDKLIDWVKRPQVGALGMVANSSSNLFKLLFEYNGDWKGRCTG